MKRHIRTLTWLLLVVAFAGATACAGSCSPGARQQPTPPAQQAPAQGR